MSSEPLVDEPALRGCILVVDPDPDSHRALQAAGLATRFDLVRVLSSETGLELLERRSLAALLLASDAPGARHAVHRWRAALEAHGAVGVLLCALPAPSSGSEEDSAPWTDALGAALETNKPIDVGWLAAVFAPALGLELPLETEGDEDDDEPGFEATSTETTPTHLPPPLPPGARLAGHAVPPVATAAVIAALVADDATEEESNGAAAADVNELEDDLPFAPGDDPWAQIQATRAERDAAVLRLEQELAARELTLDTLHRLLDDALSRAATLSSEAKLERDLATSLRDDILTAQESQGSAIEVVREEYQRTLEEQLESWETEREEALAEHEGLRSHIADLEQQLAALTAAASTPAPELDREPEVLDPRQGDAMAPRAETAAQLQAAEVDARQTHAELAALSERSRKLAADNDELTVRLEDTRSELEGARAELRRLRAHSAHVEQAEDELGSVREVLGELESRLQIVQRSAEESNARAEAAQAALEQTAQELEQERATLAAAERRLEALFAEQAASRAAAEELEQARRQCGEAVARAEGLEERMRTAEANLAEEEASRERFRTAAAERARESEALRARVVALEAQLADVDPEGLREKLDAARDAVARAEATVREEVARWQRTEAERQRLSHEVTVLRVQIPPPLPAEAIDEEVERLRKALEAAHRQRSEWVAERKRLMTEIATLRNEASSSASAAMSPPGTTLPPSKRGVGEAADATEKLRAEIRAATQSIRVCLLEIEHGRQRIDSHRQQLLSRKASYRNLVESHRKLAELARHLQSNGADAAIALQLSSITDSMKQGLRDSRMLIDSAETLSAAQEALVQRLYAALTRKLT